MTRGETIKDFFCKTILPMAAAALLYCIFRSACVKNGELDYVWLWILCGLTFGLHRMCLWIVPGGGSMGGGIALFVLNFVLAGIIGGFVLVVVSRFMRKFDSGIWQKSITGGVLRRPLGYVWAVGAQRVTGGGGRLSCP